MFKWFRWQLAKKRLTEHRARRAPYRIQHWRHERLHSPEDFPPDTAPYARMAAVWDDYAEWFTPDYTPFLAAAERYYGEPVESVLDVACGTGLQTRRLAARADRVVGIDTSEDMLRQARTRTAAGNARYLWGDFRNFRLGDTFDAALCGSDSLNYVERPEQLGQVFRCVRDHLRPGGLFAFDALNEESFLLFNWLRTEAEVGGQWFEHYRFYDPALRVCQDRLVFADGVEGHRRVPLDPRDVHRAADEAGLKVLECFGRKYRDFYLLRSTGGLLAKE